jgi:DNA-binding GntR family transcriptional regulator
VATLYDHSERYRMLSVRSRLRDTLEQHEGIYRPAVERNSAEAVRWLRQHLANTVAHLEQGIIARQGSVDDAPVAPAPDGNGAGPLTAR